MGSSKQIAHALSAVAISGMLAIGLTGCQQADKSSTANTAGQNAGNTDAAVKKLAITAIVEHPALDAVRQGVLEELANEGYQEGKNLTVQFQSAQGNTATAAQIAKQFVADKPDAIVAIATPSAQSVVASTRDIPVIFSAVTDPVEAKLMKSWDASGTNVTGASDKLPLEPQIELMKKIVPNLKHIGYVYSPGEVNSTVVLKDLQTSVAPMGIDVVAVPAQRSTDIAQAARSLQGKVDVIYTSLDNNVVSAYESLYQAAKQIKVPLVASDTDSVARGAVAALGVNYKNLGVETGKLVGRVLKGEAAGTLKPMTMSNLDLYLSPKHAQELGVTLSPELIKEAKQVEPTGKTN